MSEKFRIGDIVKFIDKHSGDDVPNYTIAGGHMQTHGSIIIGNIYDEEGAKVVCYYEGNVGVEYMDKNGKSVCLNFKEEVLQVFSPKTENELKDKKMNIDDIKNLDKDVIKTAKANVLEARKRSQTEQAEVVLTELFGVKDAIEESIGEDQEVLKNVSEDIKVFDVK